MAIDVTTFSARDKGKATTGNSLLQMEFSLGAVFGLRHKELLYREIALMLSSGLQLKSALELLAEEQKHKKRKEILNQISLDIKLGKPLEEALSASGAFSKYECISIRMGEESGRLSYIMGQLADHFKNRLAQKRTVTSALTYPIVILLTSFGAVAFMMLYMVPMFRDVFGRTGKELPAITKVVIDFSDFFVAWYGWLFLVILGISIVIFNSRKSSKFQFIKSNALNRMPIIGGYYKTGILMEWTGAMSLLLESNVPLTTALELAAKLSSDVRLKQISSNLVRSLMSGDHLHISMKNTGFFEGRLVLLIKVAEEAHALEKVFKQIAEQHREDLDHRSKILGTLLEPLIILVLGAIVGFILLAMYLPIFQMGMG